MREATREEILGKMGEGGAVKIETGFGITPPRPAGKMREESAPQGSVRVVGGIAGATGSAVGITE
jgi:hypothetical protein